MNAINKIFLLVSLLFFQINFAQAQGHRGHGKRGINIEMLKTKLDLNETQVTQVEALKEKLHEKMKAIHKNSNNDFTVMQQRRKTLMEGFHKEMKTFLSPEQQTKLESLQSERKEKFEKRKERMHKVDRKALHEEIKTYRRENILPVMQKQRAILENKISPEDKKGINDLRQIFAEKRKEHQQKRKERMESGQQMQGSPMHRKGGKHHIADKEQMEALKALVEKYDTDITSVLEPVKVNKEKWHNDMKAIHKKYMPKEAKKDFHKRGKHQKGVHGKRANHKNAKESFRKGHFLLLDPNSPLQSVSSSRISNIKVYPSPSVSQNKIEFEVKEAGRIKIDLVDQKGNVLRTIIDEFKEVGSFSQDVELTSLEGMIFYYRIVDSSGNIISKKFIKGNKK